MVYGYIRVSCDKQTVENQRFEISKFCEREGIPVDGWIEETISGTKNFDKRALGKLLKKVGKGDVIICSELSRLGRNLFMIMEILNICMNKDCRVWTIKDNYRLGDDIQSKVLAFAFGLSAEIERELISQRTKEALARRRADGIKLGRPKGRKSSRVKLSGKEAEICRLLEKGTTKSEMARRFKVNRMTVARFIAENGLSGRDPSPGGWDQRPIGRSSDAGRQSEETGFSAQPAPSDRQRFAM
ncbi:MAG: master DNA invertase Mpi family serine-type recombinase [Clostridia bacterium]|nr:master DNA invertase Mpi family serine-type recombinase [Clostridia bacterium]